MQRLGPLALVAALFAAFPSAFAQEGEATNAEIEAPAAQQPEPSEGYRPPWADPYAKPPMPGIENDPTPFNPADVDSGPSPLSNGP